MKPLLNVFGKVLKTTLISSSGVILAVLAGAADKLAQGGKTPTEIVAFGVAAGALAGLIAGVRRYLSYKAVLDPFQPSR